MNLFVVLLLLLLFSQEKMVDEKRKRNRKDLMMMMREKGRKRTSLRVACLEGEVSARESDGSNSLARAVVPATDVAHVTLGRRPHPSVTAYRLFDTKDNHQQSEQVLWPIDGSIFYRSSSILFISSSFFSIFSFDEKEIERERETTSLKKC